MWRSTVAHGRHHCFQPVAFPSAPVYGFSSCPARALILQLQSRFLALGPRTREQVRLSEILIAPPQPSSSAQIGEAQHKAQELLDAIRQGGRFADVAKANSQGPTAAKGGDLGYFDHSKLALSIEEIAFQLKVGDVSDVIHTKQGFVILQVTERPAADDVSLEVPKQPITAELGAYLAEVTQKVRQSLDKIVLESTVPSENKQGDVTIQFWIERNGAISRSKVTSRSGNTELDDAALNAICAVGPHSPLPSATKTHHLELRVHFHRASSNYGLGNRMSLELEPFSQALSLKPICPVDEIGVTRATPTRHLADG
jgi:TonB family protein